MTLALISLYNAHSIGLIPMYCLLKLHVLIIFYQEQYHDHFKWCRL
jgi:hypothetical protein